MRLGILGGTFDPVHYGHLLLAECCREAANLDVVWFMPAALPPHKQSHPLSSARHRLEMLRLAVGGDLGFAVSDQEIRRGGVSYTVDTLAQIHSEQPNAALFLLLGADSLQDFPNWRQPQRICQLATLLVVRRPDWPEPDLSQLSALLEPQRLAQVREQLVAMPLIQLSGSELRQRVARGQSIRFRTPRAVETYIQTHQLYRDER